MAKIPLNQTHSRPILYAHSQSKIAQSPSDWKDKRNIEKEKFLACIPEIKEFVHNKISSLYPKDNLIEVKTGKKLGDMDLLGKYDQTNKESCFWFTDRDSEVETSTYDRDKNKSIYANFKKENYGSRGYNYNSSGCEIGNISRDDTIALYFEDMVDNGIDVMKYLFVNDNSCDYNGKRMNTYHQEVRKIGEQIDAYSDKFFEDNDMAMEFTVPNSNYSCHQRAQLVTPEEFAILFKWRDNLEGVRLKWHKYHAEMKEKFKAYAELIRSSRNLEAVEEVWSEANEVRHKIMGTGTALALTSISASIIQQDMLARQAKDKVAVVVTPKDSTVIGSAWGSA